MAYAAIAAADPNLALLTIKRLRKRFENVVDVESDLVEAVALAMAGKWFFAKNILARIDPYSAYLGRLLPPAATTAWLDGWIGKIRRWQHHETTYSTSTTKAVLKKPAPNRAKPQIPRALAPSSAPKSTIHDQTTAILTKLTPALSISWDLLSKEEIEGFSLAATTSSSSADFFVRYELSVASLTEGFDDLLVLRLGLPFDQHWHQIETARKVLKTFRGRVLLGDEVGLGKTIEALLVMKEYLLRGLVNSVLILCPPTLVGQWEGELASKFRTSCVTTSHDLYRLDAEAFWRSPIIVASTAIARREQNVSILSKRDFDLVIVDEAHHLRNKASRNWQLVNSLRKRFMLFLSATPVQNDLVELYNLLTLLKPGVFPSLPEFKKRFVGTKDKEGRTKAKNSAELRSILRDVMIRNTRALVDIRLPQRIALTERIAPKDAEASSYQKLCDFARQETRNGMHAGQLRFLLEAAGSSPQAAVSQLERLATTSVDASSLRDCYETIDAGCKEEHLIALLRKNPSEKKMIFVRLLPTLQRLEKALAAAGLQACSFHGGLSANERDNVIASFRDETGILLCTDSAGEGRNLQFCKTIINFDLPWNPQAIEQRIGRVHRIGQTREVYIFNLVMAGTVEEEMLRILDEKIQMFELVVGEVQVILGELDDEEGEFSRRIFSAWVATSEEDRKAQFEALGEALTSARRTYETTKTYDDALFGRDLEVV